MHILLIGGTVFMGPHVVRQLVGLGHKVTVFHRGNSEPDFPGGVSRIYGDRNELDQHGETFERLKPDVVVDMVCFTEAQASQLVSVLGGIAKRIVLASSIDVYAAYGGLIGIEQPQPPTGPLTEDSPLRSGRCPYRGDTPRPDDDPRQWLDDYDKIPCEQVVLAHGGCEGVVVRLPMVYGPADRQLRLLPLIKRIDDGRPAIIIDDQTAGMRLTRGFSENMGWALALAATHPQAAGNIYNAALADPLTELEWIELVGGLAGWDGPVVTPDPAALPESMIPAHDTRYSLFADSARIREQLGYVEPVGLAESVLTTIGWQRDNYPEQLPEGMFDYAAEDQLLSELGVN